MPHDPRFERSLEYSPLREARRAADDAIGGASHECEVGWKAGVTRVFIRTMARSGVYAQRLQGYAR
jgi:hypothetical protein